MTKGEITAQNNGLIIGMTMGLQVVRKVTKIDTIRVAVAEQMPSQAHGLFINPPVSLKTAEQTPSQAHGIFVNPPVFVGTAILLEDAQ